MNRARLILTAIFSMAILGGLFASKANRTVNVFYRTTILGGLCTVPTTFRYTTFPIPGTCSYTIRVATTPLNTTLCPIIIVYCTL